MAEKATVEREFLHYTGKAGDLNRQLGLAAIAVIWLFAATSAGQTATQGPRFTLPEAFRLPLILVVISLAIDALQYCIGCGILYHLWHTKHGQADADQFQGRALVLVTMIFLKLTAMILAYLFLLPAVWQNIGYGC